MHWLALGILVASAVLAAIAAASIYTWGYRTSSNPYAGYEPVLRQWFALDRYDVAKVKHLAGPFYALRYRSRSRTGKQYCLMIDVSTRYKSTSDSPGDRFWITRGIFETGERVESAICDF